jgi:hypothetical protein
MARKPTPAAAARAPDADTTYSVELTKAVRVGRRQVLPAPGLKLRGDVLAAILADDASAVASWSE